MTEGSIINLKSPVLSVVRFGDKQSSSQAPIMADDAVMSIPDHLKLQDERIKSLESLPDEVKNQGAKLDAILDILKAGENPNTHSPPPDESAHHDGLLGIFDNLEKDESLDEFSSEEAKELESVLLSVQHEEEFGEPLLPVVTSTYELVASQHLKKEDFEEIKSRYKVPTNCKHLGVPKVNPEIWKNSNLSKRVKINDAKIQFVQHGISKAMVVLANSTETIIKNAKMIPSDTGKRVTSALLDAAKLLGTSMRELTSQRRTQFRSVLAVDISDTPAGASEYLFGDNLDDRVKASKTSSSLVKSDGFQQRRPQRFTPYSRPSTQTKQFQGNYSQGTPRNSQNLNSRWPPQVRGGGQNRWKTSRPPQSRFPQHQ